jgi:Uma2 family endonuclease
MVRRLGVFSAPDLLVEILSPGSGTHDKIRKKALYERFDVQEYWTVDPVHLLVDQYVLQEGKLRLLATHGDASVLTSPHFSCLAVNLKQVFDAAAPFYEIA